MNIKKSVIIFTSVVIFFNNSLLAQDHILIFRPLRPFPQEFVYLFTSVQIQEYKKNNTEIDPQFFSNLVKKLESVCLTSRPEEITLYFKSQIYKKFLENKKIKKSEVELSKATLSKIADLLANNEDQNIKQKYLPFPLWLISAVFYDFKGLMENPLSQSYKLLVEQKSKDGLIISSKLSLLSPLIQDMLELSPEEFNESTISLAKQLIEDIVKNLDTFVKIFPVFEKQNNPSQKCFESFKIGLIKNKEKDLENILQNFTGPSAPNTIIKNYWIPKNLPPNYPTPNPNYQAPTQLPKPINDWN